ncbi:MAG: hypothetical protein ABJP44_18335, partial [Sulfitobacter sp.]|uniref:hypothetical protein n=1 Tax=Sulfitobacter sp. TaxID=1903071 RepID=UPI0032979996
KTSANWLRFFLHRSKRAKPDRKGARALFKAQLSAKATRCFSTESAESVHSLQVRGCRASMGTADIQSATELVFVLRCGRRLRALQTNKQLDHFAAAAKSAERDRPKPDLGT